jgi:serine/threonine protein kinase
VKIVRRAKLRPSEDEFVLNEVSIMQSLSQYDKYVVQALDFYEEEEFFYLVRDYMSGGSVFLVTNDTNMVLSRQLLKGDKKYQMGD